MSEKKNYRHINYDYSDALIDKANSELSRLQDDIDSSARLIDSEREKLSAMIDRKDSIEQAIRQLSIHAPHE